MNLDFGTAVLLISTRQFHIHKHEKLKTFKIILILQKIVDNLLITVINLLELSTY